MAVLQVLLLLRRLVVLVLQRRLVLVRHWLVVLVLLRWRLVWPTEQRATTVLWLHVWLPR